LEAALSQSMHALHASEVSVKRTQHEVDKQKKAADEYQAELQDSISFQATLRDQIKAAQAALSSEHNRLQEASAAAHTSEAHRIQEVSQANKDRDAVRRALAEAVKRAQLKGRELEAMHTRLAIDTRELSSTHSELMAKGNALHKATQELNKSRAQLQTLSLELNGTKFALKTMRQSVDSEVDEKVHNIRASEKNLRVQAIQKDVLLSKLHAQISAQEKQLRDMHAAVLSQNKALIEARARLAADEHTVRKAATEVRAMVSSLNATRTRLLATDAAAHSAQQMLQERTTELNETRAELFVKDSEVSEMKSEYEAQVQMKNKEVVTLQAELAAETKELSTKNAASDEMQRQLVELTKALNLTKAALYAKNQDLARTRKNLGSETEFTRNQVASMTSKIYSLSTDLARTQFQSSAKDRAVTTLKVVEGQAIRQLNRTRAKLRNATRGLAAAEANLSEQAFTLMKYKMEANESKSELNAARHSLAEALKAQKVMEDANRKELEHLKNTDEEKLKQLKLANEKELKRQVDELDRMRSEAQEKNLEVSSMRSHVTTLEAQSTELKQTNMKLLAAVEKSKTASANLTDVLNGQIATMRRRLDAANASVLKKNKQLADAEDRVKSVLAEQLKWTAERGALQAKDTNLTQVLAAMEQKLATAHRKLNRTVTEAKEICTSSQKAANLSIALAMKDKDIAVAQTNLNHALQKVQELKDAHTRLLTKARAKLKEMKELRVQVRVRDEALNQTRMQLTKALADVQEIESDDAKAHAAIEGLKLEAQKVTSTKLAAALASQQLRKELEEARAQEDSAARRVKSLESQVAEARQLLEADAQLINRYREREHRMKARLRAHERGVASATQKNTPVA